MFLTVVFPFGSQNVDDVPLLVPMFSDSSARAMEEMIGIMQENQKVLWWAGWLGGLAMG